MKLLKKIALLLCVMLLAAGAGIGAITYSHADLTKIPPLESGDLIFETALTNQTTAILFASGSSYSHVGVVHRAGDEVTVIHAGARVIESPLSSFIKSGWGEQFTIMRYSGLTQAQKEDIVSHAEHYLGHPYNYVFHMGTDQMYCSQLPYLAFEESGVTLGTLQKIGELNVNNFAVRRIFDERWKIHPACQGADMTADTCWKAVMDELIITPVALARDPHLTTVYSNYWY